MLLSIVTPTRGNFSFYWFEQLISIQGNVEFILVYPPGQAIREFSDDLLSFTQILGALTWIPFWSLDRLLGLYLQARIFQPGLIIGHWLHGGEQVRYIKAAPSTKGETPRSYFAGDMLLALRFPKYGYFWNLFFYEMWVALKVFLRTRLSNLGKYFYSK